jgi:hypothetical protein
MNRYSLFDFCTPIIVLSSALIDLPAYGANFSTASQVNLNLTNFSLVPTNVSVIGDINSINIAKSGIVEIQGEGEALFTSDIATDTAFAFANFSTLVTGAGTDYLGQVNIISGLIGRFFIPANTLFGFDLQASALLANETSNATFYPVSSAVDIQLKLKNLSNQKGFNLLNFSGTLNTNAIENRRDEFTLATGKNFNVINSQSQLISSKNNEALLFFLMLPIQ